MKVLTLTASGLGTSAQYVSMHLLFCFKKGLSRVGEKTQRGLALHTADLGSLSGECKARTKA